MRKFITRFIPDQYYETFMFRSGIALYIAIIIFGSIPGAREDMGEVASGFVLHFTAYAVIAWLLASGARGNAMRKAVKAFVIVVAMGAFDEFVQSFFPYRTAAITDWLVDVSAAFCAALLFRLSSQESRVRATRT